MVLSSTAESTALSCSMAATAGRLFSALDAAAAHHPPGPPPGSPQGGWESRRSHRALRRRQGADTGRTGPEEHTEGKLRLVSPPPTWSRHPQPRLGASQGAQ